MSQTTTDITSSAIAEVFTQGLTDPVFFCQHHFPHWFGAPLPWVHRGIIAIITRQTDFLLKYGEIDKIEKHFVWREEIDDPDSPAIHMFEVERDEDGVPVKINLHMSRFTEIMMPRGFSKTTLSNALIIYLLCYKIRKYCVYISETGPHSEQQLRNIRNEFETNASIKSIFGSLKPEQRSGRKWTDDLIELKNDGVLAAKSRGKQVRGQLIRSMRPDFILLDDVEDDESVKTDAQRDKTLEWLYASVIPAFGRGDSGWMVMTGTLLHTEAMLRTVAQSGDFNTIIFGAIDPDGDMLWPWHMSQKEYDAKKQSYARVGKLATFYREYMNILRADETAKFKDEHFHVNYIRPREVILKAIAMDPAISDKITADSCTFGVVGMLDTGMFKVFECWGEIGMTPAEQVDKYFELRKRYSDPVPIRYSGIESIAYQAALIHLMREMMFRKHDVFEITPITHKLKKSERIEGILQPRFANNFIEFNKPLPKLRSQLLDWPNGKDDYPDVLAMAIALLDPHAALAADPEHDPAKDEYEPLENLIGRYRGAP